MKFGITARVLHWLSALVILWATATGLYIAFFELDEKIRQWILDFNVSVTFVFIPLFILRILYRTQNGVPSYHNILSETEVRIAKYGHQVLYVLVSMVLVTGVLMMEHDIHVFNLGTIPHLINDEKTLELFSLIHNYSSRILAVFVLLHILAAIKHELNGKRIIKRML